jgi:deoxyribodipyrimidine photo-lyase
MQSGTTGINIPRIYNPIKQAQDHDPNGVFVRRWLPAMRRVPDSWLFEPWQMPQQVQISAGVQVGGEVAQPVVELAQATREAKQRLHSRRQTPEVKAGKKSVIEKHASRKALATRKAKPQCCGCTFRARCRYGGMTPA